MRTFIRIIGILAITGIIGSGCDSVVDGDAALSENQIQSHALDNNGLSNLSTNIIYYEDFSSGIGDWNDGDGDYGSIIHNGIDETATIEGADSPTPFGPYSFFGTDIDRETWPVHGYITEIDVYLDPGAMSDGDGFDLSVASYNEGGSHLRDFIIHVGKVDGELLINGSNNSDWSFNAFKLLNNNDGAYATITEAGWYTLQHSFNDEGGSLAVDLNVFNAVGDKIFSATRHNVDDLIDGVVGGVGYMWFVYASSAFDIDNQLLAYNELTPDEPESKEDCMNGGFEDFGFKNQGQCIRYVNTGQDSR